MTLGSTLGEEALCDKNLNGRAENCFAEVESAAICINRDGFNQMKNKAKLNYIVSRDVSIIEEVLRNNYSEKRRWRSGFGFIIEGVRIIENDSIE